MDKKDEIPVKIDFKDDKAYKVGAYIFGFALLLSIFSDNMGLAYFSASFIFVFLGFWFCVEKIPKFIELPGRIIEYSVEQQGETIPKSSYLMFLLSLLSFIAGIIYSL